MASRAEDDDLALIPRIGAGDILAAEAFDQKFRPLLYRFLAGRIPVQDRQDLVQEVLIAAVQKMRDQDGFRGSSSLGTWLIGILKHKVADHWEAHRRERDRLVPIPAAPLLPTGSHLDAICDVRQVDPDLLIELEQTLALLPKDERVFLILNLREGWTTEEIAAAVKMPVGTVGRILWRAKRALRRARSELKKLPPAGDQ